jgi:hypothetical protein
MGTNYYIRNNMCKECWRCEEEIHLWKSSWGWDFCFQYNGGKYYTNYEEFKKFLTNKVIFDEYSNKWGIDEFLFLIEEKRKKYGKKHLNENGLTGFYVDDYYFYDSDFS